MNLKQLNEDSITSKISACFCSSLSEDNRLAILTDNGVEVFHFRFNPQNKVGDIDYRRSVLYPLKHYPTESAEMDQTVYTKLDRDDLFETLFDPVLLPHLPFGKDMILNICQVAWSPAGVVDNRDCVIALLTNAGSVTVWKYEASAWHVRADISNFISRHLQDTEQLKQLATNDHSKYFQNHRDMCNRLVSTAIAWSATHKLNNLIVTFLATAQRSGEIYLWKFTSDKSTDNDFTVDRVSIQTTNLNYITIMYWLQISAEKLLLVIGDVNGVLECLHLAISQDFVLGVLKTAVLWSDSDRMKPSHISSICLHNSQRCLIIIKGSFFIVINLDENGDLSSTAYKDFSNIAICGVQHMKAGRFMVSVLTGVNYMVEVALNETNEVEFVLGDKINCDIDFSRWGQFGLCVSRNNAICMVIMSPCKPMTRLYGKIVSKVVFLHMDNFDPMEVLLDNKSKVLTHHLDCLELARVLTVKSREIPTNWPMVFDKTMPSYEMKICLMVQTMAKAIMDIIAVDNRSNILTEILLKHCQAYIQQLIQKHNLSSLNDNELATIMCLCSFLSKMSTTDDLDPLLNKVTDTFKNPLPKFVKSCDWCDEDLQGALCPKNHPQEWCCITLQDLDVVGNLVCSICASLARRNLLPHEPICTFCDSYLNNSYLLDEKTSTGLSETKFEIEMKADVARMETNSDYETMSVEHS